MPFDLSFRPPTASTPWSSDLVFLKEDDRPFQEGGAERLGVEEGVYKFMDGIMRPYFVDGKYTPTYRGDTLGVSQYDKPDPGFLDTLAAAFRQENLIGSGLASRATAIPDDEYFKVTPGYDVYDNISGYESYADRFTDVYNPMAADAVKADIDRENQDREVLAASGWTPYLLSLAGANLLDPTILMPGGALVKGGRLGYSAGKTALNVGAHAGAAAALSEIGLQATQQTRTPSESFLAIGGSMLLGGIIGTAGARRCDLPEQDPELNRQATP